MTLFNVFIGTNFGIYNRNSMHAIGLTATILLGEILDKYQYFLINGQLVELSEEEGKWFYITQEELEFRTSLSRREQETILEKLIDLKFIEKKIRGLPARRYFKINEAAIQEFVDNLKNYYYFGESVQTGLAETYKLDWRKCTNSPIVKRLNKKKKNIKKKGDSPPPPPHILPFSFKRVKMEKAKYDKLVEEFGKPMIDSYLEKLDEYADINPKRFKQYACHATVIRKWIREEKAKASKHPNASNSSLKAPGSSINELECQNREFIKELIKRHPNEAAAHITSSHSMHYIEFTLSNGHAYKIYYSDLNFKDLVIHEFNKRRVFLKIFGQERQDL
jgi:hypothetical protein